MEKGILENHADEIIGHLGAIKDTLEVYKNFLNKDLVRTINKVEDYQDIMNAFRHGAVRLDRLVEERKSE